ncbi:competence protein ComGF [Helicobacter valdiviensis]|uniref:Competence protein ComGF n=1 Tax=Helicobacter valdiviensis TaxID=1458358 RepID=A0A2W6MY47_9HELI|nr:HD domain-containing protein [Helicobacter valdiviensis]PZT48228.1 competence protein ComGF [Helicobacter valdiviensis]
MRKPRLSHSLLQKIFMAASIRRWNDQATPVEFWELDKQAHKIFIAYLLAHFEKIEHKKEVDFERLILQFCYEFFERIILTDIKPPVFHQLVKNHNEALVDFVCEELKEELEVFPFFEDMRIYLYGGVNNLEKEILKAAHYYASKWEFDIIYHFNPKMYDVQNIKNIIDKQVEEHYHLAGIRQIKLYNDLKELVNMFGQLRFQKRWSQTPRVPATSVLGHTLVVGLCAFLLGYDLKAGRQMQINHFLCGLFHDLPEILTRDIISPIKRSVEGLDTFIKQIEEEAVREKIFSKVPKEIEEDIYYYIQEEFSNRYKDEKGQVCYLKKGEEILHEFGGDCYSPIYGEFLKYCDHLSAFLEAKISIRHGISSKELEDGAKNLEYMYNNKVINGVDLGYLYREFRG